MKDNKTEILDILKAVYHNHLTPETATNLICNDLTPKKEYNGLPLYERVKMRKQAITVFELTKGFCGEPKDNAMKTALEMAGYVMKLTINVE